MLVIREAQMEAFARELEARFERKAIAHVKDNFPEACEAVGEDGVRYYVRHGLSRARSHGFISEYDLLRYLNLVFALGADFDTAEEHAWAGEILESRAASPTTRMDQLMEAAYARLFPSEPSEGGEEAAKTKEEFDGVVWEDDFDPNYVPVSIVPEKTPYEKFPNPFTSS